MQQDIYFLKEYKKRIKSGTSNRMCIGLMIVIAGLLLARDAFGVGVNKYLLLLLLVPVLLLSKERYALMLWVFLMPLYVGLPGNYITLILLLRFLLQRISNGRFKVYQRTFMLTVFLATFVFIQNIFYNDTGIYHMIFVAELFVVYFFVTEEHQSYFPNIMLSYSFGVAMTGIIMLIATLQTYSFEDLLSVATRLGYVGRTSEMTVIIDPNYYGLFALTVLSCNWLMIIKKIYSKKQKIFSIILTATSVATALIGLSRAFILCFVLWIILSVLFEKRLSSKMRVLIIGIVCIIVAYYAFPDAVQMILERFTSADMETGNGRTVILEKMGKEWGSSVFTMLFGIGLFNCNVHFMQMQYFFGLGIVGFFMIFVLGICYWKWMKRGSGKFSWDVMIPIVIVQVSASSVPTAQSLTFMMPVVMSLLVFGAASNSGFKE